MSTAGTLYDETIKNGFAKLLSITACGTAATVGISIPTGYDSYWFDLDALYFTLDNGFLVARVSTDNGASYKADSYWWSATTIWGNLPAGTVSQYGSSVLGGGHTTWLFLTHGNWISHPAMGRVRIWPTGANISTVVWKTGSLQNGNYNATHFGSGFYASSSLIVNAMQFLTGNGGTFNGGTIRLFGLKNGT